MISLENALTYRLRPRSQPDPPRPSPVPYFGILCLHLGRNQSTADSSLSVVPTPSCTWTKVPGTPEHNFDGPQKQTLTEFSNPDVGEKRRNYVHGNGNRSLLSVGYGA